MSNWVWPFRRRLFTQSHQKALQLIQVTVPYETVFARCSILGIQLTTCNTFFIKAFNGHDREFPISDRNQTLLPSLLLFYNEAKLNS